MIGGIESGMDSQMTRAAAVFSSLILATTPAALAAPHRHPHHPAHTPPPAATPPKAPEAVARLGGEVLLDWGGGLIWALLPEGTDARSRAAPYSGQAMLVRAGPDTRARISRFEPQPAPVAALAAGLRARFDPRGLFDPGLMA